jgi:hypothetical protein
MKGIIFTEFLEMVERDYGFEILNGIIDKSKLESNGIYSGVGTYEFKEFGQLVKQLSLVTDIKENELLIKYGHYVFDTFYNNYGDFFANIEHPFQLLEQVDSHIHIDVKILYPDAELPRFETKRIGSDTMEMLYSSKRRMEYFALGLMEASFIHFSINFTINMEDKGNDTVLFKITSTE